MARVGRIYFREDAQISHMPHKSKISAQKEITLTYKYIVLIMLISDIV